ncbi:grpb/dephospho-CoA kinase [Tricladium varicosporioides]|nr:grpb/dephospho-CoA kinase [Hymenoscyphus varicosporioides]
MKISVEPHNPAWLAYFKEIKNNLTTILKDVSIISIQHVGSTSVPGLPAKPVLDIDIIVTADNVLPAREALVRSGYTDLGDMGIVDRYAFRQPGYQRHEDPYRSGASDKGMRMNTYVIVEGCLALRNHQDVQRVLLEDEELRREYGEVKLKLAEGEVKNIDEYCDGKDQILKKIMRKAGWKEEEIHGDRKEI